MAEATRHFDGLRTRCPLQVGIALGQDSGLAGGTWAGFEAPLTPHPGALVQCETCTTINSSSRPLSLQSPLAKPPLCLETELLQLREENCRLRSQLGQMDPKGMSSPEVAVR